MKKRIGVIGCGSWGTAVANVFADAGHETEIWGRDVATVKAITETHTNPRYLKGVPLNPALKGQSDLPGLIAKSDILVNAIPTQQIRNVFAPLAAKLAGKTLINTSKGIEMKTHSRVSEIYSSFCPSLTYAILSGPSFALETARRLPTAITLACADKKTAEDLQALLATPYFRVYSSTDVIGVELAGALKNVIAIASGMLSGLKLGYNTQAALINRGLAEMIRIGDKLGAEERTFFGLAGVGDLILTCTGPLSRNRTLGELIGQGKKISEAIQTLGGVAEGFYTAESAWQLAQISGTEAPITEQVYGILYQGRSPQEALTQLMGRNLKEEW